MTKEPVKKNMENHLFTLNKKVYANNKAQENINFHTKNALKKVLEKSALLNMKKKVQMNFETFSKLF